MHSNVCLDFDKMISIWQLVKLCARQNCDLPYDWDVFYRDFKTQYHTLVKLQVKTNLSCLFQPTKKVETKTRDILCRIMEFFKLTR